MSKVLEFAISSTRLALIAVCLLFAGLIGGAALFTAGVLLAPNFRAVEADSTQLPAGKLPQAKIPDAPKLPDPAKAAGASVVLDFSSPAAGKTATDNDAGAPKPETAMEVPPETPLIYDTPTESPEKNAARSPIQIAAAKPADVTKPTDPKPSAAAEPEKHVAQAQPPVQLDVRVGSFADEKNATQIVDRLKQLGYPASAFEYTDARSRRWQVVHVGPYSEYEAASKTVLDLTTRYRLSPLIIPAKAF